jgi:hypothetical protein
MVKRSLTEQEKLTIIENMHHKTPGRLGQILNRCRQTVFYFIKRYHQRKSLQNLRRSGRKHVIGLRTKTGIKNFLESYPGSTVLEIKKKLKLNCCSRTIIKTI